MQVLQGWLTRLKNSVSSGPGPAVAAAIAAAVAVAGVVAAMALTGGSGGGLADSQGLVVGPDNSPAAGRPGSTTHSTSQPSGTPVESGSSPAHTTDSPAPATS